MRTSKDGGPAFPVSSYLNDGGESRDSSIQGMSLRDWFAGMALIGLCANSKELVFIQCSEDAFILADIMLKERQK